MFISQLCGELLQNNFENMYWTLTLKLWDKFRFIWLSLIIIV